MRRIDHVPKPIEALDLGTWSVILLFLFLLLLLLLLCALDLLAEN